MGADQQHRLVPLGLAARHAVARRGAVQDQGRAVGHVEQGRPGREDAGVAFPMTVTDKVRKVAMREVSITELSSGAEGRGPPARSIAVLPPERASTWINRPQAGVSANGHAFSRIRTAAAPPSHPEERPRRPRSEMH